MEAPMDDSQEIQLRETNMEKITINVNEAEFLAEIPDGEGDIMINGKPVKVRELKQYTSSIFSFVVNNRILLIELDLHEKGDSYINADGFYHKVEITNDTKKLIQKYLRDSGAGVESGHARIKSPMPGMVVKILTEEGAEVRKGDKLIIIEAMKMENSITSPIAGRVIHINAREGQAVEKEAFLIEIENTN
jgi:biotin carboxyl carrier protein